jgi:peptidoglycan/xylan/chitin deacetylase (PgdA/CDA1 family)
VTALSEALLVPFDLVRGAYPPFVTGGPLPVGHVPVFVFHTLEPETFERQLLHLHDNGYVTLSGEEYLLHLTGKRSAPERAVLLTLDDGRESVASVGRPLLERYGMHAVVFLIPGRMAALPTEPRPGVEGLLSWHEVEALARTGRLAFESHSLSHARIHVAPEVVDFVAPAMRRGYAALDLPLFHDGDKDLEPAAVPLGTPVLRWQARLSEARRFFEDPGVRAPSVRRVAAEGEAFFVRPGWRAELVQLTRARRVEGRYETEAERDAAIGRELSEAKRLIEARTGRSCRLLCYPWHVASGVAERLAREAGYRAAFVGKDPRAPIALPGADPMRLGRIGEDWIETLPGKRRVSAFEVLRRKWRRRQRKT